MPNVPRKRDKSRATLHTSNDVAGNIQRIAEQNEQTSRLVAESAEIAGSLSQTASQLEALVGRFRISRG